MTRFNILAALLLFVSQFTFAAEGDTIKVVFSDSSADVNIPSTASVTSVVSGAYVTLKSTTTAEEYVYDISGSTSAGNLTITGSYKLTLRLNGVSITSQKGAAIDVECGKRIAVELADGTTNTLVDYASGSQKSAFYTTGHPEFQDSGTLNVTGNAKHAICAKEYLQIKKSTGTINILSAVKDGIHCGKGKAGNENNYFLMNGGTLNISNVGSDCIESDDYGTVTIKGGTLNLSVSAQGAEGIKADSLLTITDGTINIDVTGIDCVGIKSAYEAYFKGGDITISASGNGSKGIKGKQNTADETDATVVNGGGVFFSDSVNVNITASGANYIVDTDTTKCMGMSVDSCLVHTGGFVYILAKGGNSYTYNVKGTESTTTGFYAEYEGATAIQRAAAKTEEKAIQAIYSTDGQLRTTLYPGINIVVYKNGEIKKVIK